MNLNSCLPSVVYYKFNDWSSVMVTIKCLHSISTTTKIISFPSNNCFFNSIFPSGKNVYDNYWHFVISNWLKWLLLVNRVLIFKDFWSYSFLGLTEFVFPAIGVTGIVSMYYWFDEVYWWNNSLKNYYKFSDCVSNNSD